VVTHADRGVQFTSWALSQKVRDAGLAPSMGAVGDPYDNAMVQSFRGRMLVELLNRQGWKTRIEVAGAIRDCTELCHHARRRHSSLNARGVCLAPYSAARSAAWSSGLAPI
jgi:putative transposase